MTAATSRIRGSITSLVTPFLGGEIDEAQFRRLVAWQTGNGADGLLVGACEGEGPALSRDERVRLVALARRTAPAHVPVLGAVLANGTATAAELVRALAEAGADALLVSCPFYNKPTQEGVFEHFAAVATTSRATILIDNRPSRCAIDMKPELVARLARLPTIIGICDASNDPVRPMLTRTQTPEGFVQLCGDDRLMPSFNLNGGVGAVTTIGNLAPKTCKWLQEACGELNWRGAQALQDQLNAIIADRPDWDHPASLKRELVAMGRLPNAAVRLPEVAQHEVRPGGRARMARAGRRSGA